MIVRGREFDDIYDLVGIRVLVDSVRDCYAVLGAIHARWNPMPGRFKDYIAMPEVQPLPVAAHHGDRARAASRSRSRSARTRCTSAPSTASPRTGSTRRARKSAGAADADSAGTDMAWLRAAGRLAGGDRRPQRVPRLAAVRDRRRTRSTSSRRRATSSACRPGRRPVDFAYAVHTEVGHRTMGARVNGRLVPLDSSLENGDVVEVFTSKIRDAGPSRDWLGFVKSPRARNKIRQWFTKERREEAIEQGKDAIARAMRKQNLPIQRLLSHESLVAVANEMRYDDVSALYAAIGEGHVSAASVVEQARAVDGRRRPATRRTSPRSPGPGTTQRRRPHRRLRRPRQGRRRHLGQARQVLHAGARRRRSSAS